MEGSRGEKKMDYHSNCIPETKIKFTFGDYSFDVFEAALCTICNTTEPLY